MTAIGVLGGSFDPVHWGHLHVALLAREATGLDAVWFLPAADPPHKRASDLAPAPHRAAMLRAALADEPHTDLCDLELEPGASHYTVDSLRELARRHPGTRFRFILGGDSLRDLDTWHQPETIRGEFGVIAVDRPGRELELTGDGRGVQLVRGNPFAISATGVRERVLAGGSIRHLVPAPVREYIESNGLYRPVSAGA